MVGVGVGGVMLMIQWCEGLQGEQTIFPWQSLLFLLLLCISLPLSSGKEALTMSTLAQNGTILQFHYLMIITKTDFACNPNPCGTLCVHWLDLHICRLMKQLRAVEDTLVARLQEQCL